MRPTISYRPQGISLVQEGANRPSSTKDALVVSEIVGRKAAVSPFLVGRAAVANDYDYFHKKTCQALELSDKYLSAPHSQDFFERHCGNIGSQLGFSHHTIGKPRRAAGFR